MKTTEEFKPAVLAECERLFDELSPTRFKPYPSYPDISKSSVNGIADSYTVWPFGDDSAYFMVIYTDRSLVDDQWRKAYRLLGLEARDAVQAERSRLSKRYKSRLNRLRANDAETHRIQIEVKDERIAALQAKSAALVEASKNFAIAVKSRIPVHSVIHELVELEKALQAHKKGATT